MSYKTILAYFSNEKHARNLMSAASRLAADHSAHLVGIYVVPKIWLNPAVSMEIPADFLSSQRQHYVDEASRIETIFNGDASAAGISAEWRTLQSPDQKIAPVVVEQSRTADLVILGQVDEIAEADYTAEVPTAVLMESGRPVLIIPFDKQVKEIGEYIALAWNGTREATRATYDALPFLTSAKEVKMICVDMEGDGADKDTAFGSELATTLARHEITVIVSDSPKKSISIGAQLLEEAEAGGCDLLVAGGYGHSRSREFIFGGATKYILKNMTIPVLISH